MASPSPKNIDINNLQPGDILLFRPQHKPGFMNKLLMFFQSLNRQTQGHYDTTHTAICVSNNDGKPIIAHIANRKGKRLPGYVQENLNTDRPFVLFRHNNSQVAEQIAEVAGNVETNKDIKWSFMASIARFLKKSKVDSSGKHQRLTETPRKNSVASQFVIECLKIAMENQEHNSSINLRTRSSPKALESYLYNHQGSQQFNMHCYVGKDALEKLVKEIRKQNERIRTASNKHLPQAQNKYVAIGMASLIAMDNIKKIQEERKNKNQEPLNPLESCLYLLNEVLPKMKVSTGETFTTPTSYKSVISLARNLGIFQKDIEDYAKRPEDQKIPSAPSTPRKPS